MIIIIKSQVFDMNFVNYVKSFFKLIFKKKFHFMTRLNQNL